MISNINYNLQLFDSIQDYWIKAGDPYKLWVGKMNYHQLSAEKHYQDGWRDYVDPPYDPAIEKLGELYHDQENDVVTRTVIPKTEEELKAVTESEKQSRQAELLEQKKTEQAMNSFQTITDEAEALAVKEVYPDWSVEEDYLKRTAGYKVTRTLKGSEGYEVRLFFLIQPHTPQDQSDYYPENAPALWSEIKSSGGVEIWTQPIGGDGKYPYLNPETGQPYEVSHNGQIWVNNVPAPTLNVWEPGVFGWTIKT